MEDGSEKLSAEKEVLTRLLKIEAKLDALQTLPKRINELEASVQLISDKFDEFQNRLTDQEKTPKNFVSV